MMSDANPLTLLVLRAIQAESRRSLTITLPREHAVPLIAAAMAAYEAGLVPVPAGWMPPAPVAGQRAATMEREVPVAEPVNTEGHVPTVPADWREP